MTAVRTLLSSIFSSGNRKRAALGGALCLLFAGAAVSSAQAATWWQLGSGTRPAQIQAGSGRDEVQSLLVKAKSGTYTLTEPESLQAGHPKEEGVNYANLPFNAGAAQIQAALEGLYGAGDVEVAAGPEAAEFLITFTGAKGSQPIPLGAEGKATLTELAKGRADGEIFLTAENLGDATIQGGTNPVTITDALPPGLREVGILASYPEGTNSRRRFPCAAPPAAPSCTFEAGLYPFGVLEVRIAVVVEAGASSGELNAVHIAGGASPAASFSRPVTLGPEPAPFGVEDFRLALEEDGGGQSTQAGSHPYQFTTTVAINQGPARRSFGTGDKAESEPAALPKDVYTKLPVGLIGNPTAYPTCSLAQFFTTLSGESENSCSTGSSLGAVSIIAHEPSFVGQVNVNAPLQNLEPAPGEPARFGFYALGAALPIVLDTSLRSGAGEGAVPGVSEDYGIDVNATNVSEAAGLQSARVTVFGVPGDPRHDASHGFPCLHKTEVGTQPGGTPCLPSEETHPPAFLTLPTSCAGPLQASLEADPWVDPADRETVLPTEPLPAMGGCNRLPFDPAIAAEPTSNAATSPTGFAFDLTVPNEGLENAEGLASSEIKRTVVTLPQGFTTNPSVAEGLKACSLAEFTATTIVAGSGCSEESKIGAAEIDSPVVTQKIDGSIFVARQKENSYGNLLTLYLVFRSPELGILVKQALKVTPDPVSGQLSTEVDNIPQLPFSRLHLEFRSGQRAPLITPPACGTYTVGADLYPWSDPSSSVHRESSFKITQGPEGQGCPSGGVPPFHPNLEAGTINNLAGSYSPFYTHMTRRDSEQEITHFSIKLPPGVSGKLAGIPYCSDAGIAQAKSLESVLGGGSQEEASPSCPKASEVGHSLVGSGVGNVLAYAPGKLYLAGPYHGSNLSLVSITAAKVGPFDLGTVVVRFALKIDPETAEVSVDGATSDPIPHIVDGIPVHLRDIRAYVDKPQFVLNPTSCKKTSTASTVLGSGLNFASEADDQPVTVTSPFQAADCASLGFAPKLALSLKGGTKRGSTPAFKAVLTYPKGSYANIASSQVTLPHSEFLEQSHIKTICTRVQFKEGKVPGEKCPAASIYGRARAVTPILDEPLEGPVYLRSSSHNLPDLVASLNNRQVNIALDGRIDSVENGRIRNTFEAVPDAPVSKFVLEMQGGKKGLLVNSTNVCTKKNHAISHFVGQNGKVYDTNPVLQAQCGGKAKKKGKGGKKGKRHR